MQFTNPICHRRALRFAATGLLALLLASCGGGGSGGSSPAPTPEPEPATFSIRGVLIAPPGQSRDGDTNDPRDELNSNDDPANPQPIGNPTTLGGYVNEAGAGAEGRSQLDGDPEDFFEVELLAGQRINLLVAEFRDADADLYLYDEQGELVDFSIATGELEEVSVTRNGRYIVNVSIFAGATNYTLAVGAPLTPAAQNMAGADEDVIPWDAVIQYRDDAAAREAQGDEDLLRRWDARRVGGGVRRAQLLRLRSKALAYQVRQARLGRQVSRLDDFANPELAARWETVMAIKHLRRQPDVLRAEPNYRVRPFASVNDESFAIQWHYPLVNVPGAWDTTVGAPEVVVAVVDTGILAGHPDLQGQLVPGYDFVRDAEEAGDGDGIDPDPEESVGGGNPDATNYHGTHVLGTIGARGNNGIGVAGIAYGARVMAVRALGITGGTTYDVRQAVRFAAGLDNDSDTVPERPADIINLSLGGGGFSQLSQDLYNELRELGVIVVAAAGNESSSAPSYPAAYDNVFSVSAVDVEQSITAYSNRGSTVDIAAPGGNGSRDLNGDGYPDGVLSTGANAGRFSYTFLSGTSMASPHVAGIFALMKSANPDIDAATIERLLVEGRITEDLGAAGRDNLYGYGLIDARRAVDAALVAGGAESQLPPRLASSTSALNFGTSRSSLEISMSNSGSGEVSISAVESPQPWISINAVSVDENGLGRYSISVDRLDLAPGIFEGEVIARSSANDLSIRVLAAVADETEADLGTVYLVIFDPETEETVASGFLDISDNGYRFEAPEIPPGDYQIFAGTDIDNDQTICDAGEACGVYLTVEQPLTVTVDGDLSNIEFPIEYLLSLPGSAANSANALVPVNALKLKELKP